MGNLTKRYAAGSNLACAAARLMTPHVIISRPLCIAPLLAAIDPKLFGLVSHGLESKEAPTKLTENAHNS